MHLSFLFTFLTVFLIGCAASQTQIDATPVPIQAPSQKDSTPQQNSVVYPIKCIMTGHPGWKHPEQFERFGMYETKPLPLYEDKILYALDFEASQDKIKLIENPTAEEIKNAGSLRSIESATVEEIKNADLGWKCSYDAQVKITLFGKSFWIQTGRNDHNRVQDDDGGWEKQGFQPAVGDKLTIDMLKYEPTKLIIYSISNQP